LLGLVSNAATKKSSLHWCNNFTPKKEAPLSRFQIKRSGQTRKDTAKASRIAAQESWDRHNERLLQSLQNKSLHCLSRRGVDFVGKQLQVSDYFKHIQLIISFQSPHFLHS
jgi:hypothetical protein